MPSRRVLTLFLLALVLRLVTQDWSSGLLSPHPDERQVAFASEKAEGWFADPELYAYGSLHFQMVRATAAALGKERIYAGLLVGGRALSLLSSLAAIMLGWAVARRAWGRRTGELFLVLVAWVPLDLQQSHFATVEAHHSFWVMLTLAACFWLGRRATVPGAVLAGLAFGATLAVKVASLALVIPVAVGVLAVLRRDLWLRGLRLGATAAAAALASFWLCQPRAFEDGQPPLVLLLEIVACVVLLLAAARCRGVVRIGAMAVACLAAVAAAAQVVVLLGQLASAGGAEGWLGRLGGAAEVIVVPPVARLAPEYLRGVGEQVAMVVGRADLDYARVFRGTLPVFYPLRELGLWGLGPLLLAAALAGSCIGARRLASTWRRWLVASPGPSVLLLALVLAWLAPMAACLSTLHVKYLRYWEPLVVPAVMLAAWALQRLRPRRRRLAVRLTTAGTVLWGLMYLSAFLDPHPHRTAAEWLSQRVEPGQAVAFEHWDESLAVQPEGGKVERLELASYELPDDDAKVAEWCQTLARADWVVLTSNRVRRTVLANAKRFPRTGRLYRLLLAGEAGFEPLTTVARGPRLLGLELPVQLADESFVSYDFPRVVVLRRVAGVNAEQLAERSRRPLPYLEHLGLAGVEGRLVDPLPRLPSVPTRWRQLADALLWLVVLAGSAAGLWALLLPVLRALPDAGCGLAVVSGWLLPPWLLWLGSEAGVWRVGGPSATVLFLTVVVIGAVAGWHRRQLVSRLWRQRRRAMLTVLVVTCVVWLTFLVIRAGNPAIHWGEKPMDFSFLNAFVNAPEWPPDEPWMAGMSLHYYYMGWALASFPVLVSGTTPGVGYNLMAATVPALAAAALASLGLAVAGSRRRGPWAAALLPLLVLLTGNLAWPRLLDLARAGRWFDMWWATSRVIPGAAIDEYPLWTALFADLHSHFVALPVLLAALLWGGLTLRLGKGRWPVAAGLCGISAGVLAATNPWDLFVLAGALAIGSLVGPRPLVGLVRLLVAAVVSIFASLPFVLELVVGVAPGLSGALMLNRGELAPAQAILVHLGVFLVPLLVVAAGGLVARRRGPRSACPVPAGPDVPAGSSSPGRGPRARVWLAALPAGAVAVYAGVALGSSAAVLALACGLVFLLALVDCQRPWSRLAWALAGFSMAAIVLCERFTFLDRMNTVFKVYNGVWVLLAVALGLLLLDLRGGRRRALVALWLPLELVGLVNVPLGVAQGWLQPRMRSPRPTLDGQAFLRVRDPQTWFLVRTLQGVARPGEVVAEAAGIPYAELTRVAMHTGQPTVVGWEHHLHQRGQARQEIQARFVDLEELYAGVGSWPRRQVLERYRVAWVVLADTERRAYGLTSENPLSAIPGLVRLATHGGAALYRVVAPAGARARVPPMTPAHQAAGLQPLSTLGPLARLVTAPSLAVGVSRAVLVLGDGAVVELAGDGQEIGELRAAPCRASSAAVRSREVWLSCRDGRVFSSGGDDWSARGRLECGSQLAAGDGVWGWGDAGLWRWRETAQWQQVSSDRVVAAAGLGAGVAWSNGQRIWVGRGADDWQEVATPLDGVRALAWQGPVLWALDRDGLYRSGGAVLPWRRVLAEAEPLATIAGGSDRLWLLFGDGQLAEAERQTCQSPWQRPAADGAAGLAEPRGVAVSPGGWFVVADTQNHQLRYFGPRGAFLDSFGSEGKEPGELREPSGLAMAADGTLAVADTWNGRVQVIEADGATRVVGKDLYGPRGVLWAPDGALVVADTGNRRVLRFQAPSWEEEVVAELDGPVVGLAWSDGLLAAAVPATGNLVLIDPVDGAVVRYLAVPGWQEGGQQEGYVAVLPGGDLLATAPAPGELWRLDPTGATPARRVADDLPGVTALTVLPGGEVLAAQTWEHHLVRLRVD